MATTTVNNTRPPSATKINGGWFSKFFITAAHLFTSSIFCKNINSIQEIPQPISAPQRRKQREDFVDIKLGFNYNGITMSEQELSSRFDDIFELERLIHQKCFTEEEIDFLDRLIHSKVVEPGNNLLLQRNQSKEKENGDSNTNSKDDLDCSKPPKEPPPSTPSDSASTEMIRRPYCRSALSRRISRFSRKNQCSDLIRPLKWRRPSQLYTSPAIARRLRSDAKQVDPCHPVPSAVPSGAERPVPSAVPSNTARYQQYRANGEFLLASGPLSVSACNNLSQRGLKRSRSDWNAECSDDDGERRVRRKVQMPGTERLIPSAVPSGIERPIQSAIPSSTTRYQQYRANGEFLLASESLSASACNNISQRGLKRSRTDWNTECSDDDGERRVRRKVF